jgi:hypothetical protein
MGISTSLEALVRAELRSIHSPDVDDLERFAPSDPDCFGVLLQLFVGPSGEPGEESFDVVICSAGWLASRTRVHGPISGLHHLVVAAWDWEAIRGHCERQVSSVDESTWRDLALKLNQFARWEFADYD